MKYIYVYNGVNYFINWSCFPLGIIRQELEPARVRLRRAGACVGNREDQRLRPFGVTTVRRHHAAARRGC